MQFNFMDKVIAVSPFDNNYTKVECLFISYYKMKSAHKRCLLHCPKLKKTFFYSLHHLIKHNTHGKIS